MFDGHAQFVGASQNQSKVEREGLAAQQQSSRRMTKNPHIRILKGAENPRCHLFAALVKPGVNAGDDNLHLRQGLVLEVERAIGQNVYFDPREDAYATFHCAINGTDTLDVLERPPIIEPIGHGQVLRVIGNGDVAVPHSERGLRHFANGVVPVGGAGVHMQIAANGASVNQLRHAALRSTFNLAQVLAQFGGDTVHLQRRVNLLFAL